MNRALLVGINKYIGCPLRGCVDDVTDMADYLVSRGFKREEIRLLVDERATKQAIVERLLWLKQAMVPGNHVVFQYSGHGAQVPTRNPQGEVDGLDEAICPVDFDWTDLHMLRDKEFNAIFQGIPAGTNVVWLSDSCHSGDLTKEMMPHDHATDLHKLYPCPADIDWRLQTAREKGIRATKITGRSTPTGLELNLAYISGCKSNQTSADANFQGRYNGAMTYALLHVLKNNPLNTPLSKIVPEMDKFLCQSHYSQVPQLEGANDLKDRPLIW